METAIPNYSYRIQIIILKVLNNLFNAKKFVFPSFTFNVQGVVTNSPDGYISWSDLHSIFDQDSKLPANLRKANKLAYRAMHPGNNKQFVNLALSFNFFMKVQLLLVKAIFQKENIFPVFFHLFIHGGQ